ncbi:hypothetical protein [Thermococcus sp.]|uniref:hypothetical protein n=1 Tax=Thermococcus sp. TaxID=35749 RepID=UPI00260BFA33|nr:hypothetical protein [Thermococcus sp.]
MENTLSPLSILEKALGALSEGDFTISKDEFDRAEEELRAIVEEIYSPLNDYKAGELFQDVFELEEEIPCIVQEPEAKFNKKGTLVESPP